MYPVQRDLDGVYFRVKRGDKWKPVCYTDLTEEEIEQKTADMPADWWQRVANHLAEKLREVGDEFDIRRE